MSAELLRPPAVALTIAGSDCSAGAGAQADLKTFAAHGVYGLTVITCVVAETPGKVVSIAAVPAEVVRDQIDVLFGGFPIAAVKTGMLYSAEVVSVVAKRLRDHQAQTSLPIIVDPVMVATSGDRLLEPEAIELYQTEMFSLATLVTPNLDEARVLLGRSEKIDRLDDARRAARELSDRFGVPFLVKGGHLTGEPADILFLDGEMLEFTANRLEGVNTHGTGCTYAAAIAAQLALGTKLLPEAIARAKEFVTEAIRQHHSWPVGGDGLQALNHSPARDHPEAD